MARVRWRTHAPGSGLTTTKAPFIEQAQQEGRLYIHQPYELYSDANHEAWREALCPDGGPVAAVRQSALPAGHRQPVPRSRRGSRGWTTSIDFSARSPASRRKRSAATSPRSSSSTASATANFPRPSPFETAPLSTICPSRTSSTTSPATSRCTPTGPLRTRWFASAIAPIRRRKSWPAFETRRRRSGVSPASSRRWRGSSGSRSSSA